MPGQFVIPEVDMKAMSISHKASTVMIVERRMRKVRKPLGSKSKLTRGTPFSRIKKLLKVQESSLEHIKVRR
jgi:hypothetical protein